MSDQETVVQIEKSMKYDAAVEMLRLEVNARSQYENYTEEREEWFASVPDLDI